MNFQKHKEEKLGLPLLACPTPESTIKCLFYATYSRAGGRCDGDMFRDDPNNQWVFLPESVANTFIGKNNVTFTLGDQQINGQSAILQSPNTMESNRLKVLAYCNAYASTHFLKIFYFSVYLFIINIIL